MATRTDRLRWGDEDPDEDELLPPSEEIGPDENGIRQKIEFYRNEKGQIIKKTTKTREVEVERKVYKISQERKKWKRFGAATENTEGVTAVSTEDIPFENVRTKEKTMQQSKIDDITKNLELADKQTIIAGMDNFLKQRRDARNKLRAQGVLKPESEQAPDTPSQSKPPTNSNKYVPPRFREGHREDKYTRPGNENSVRVTNISDEVDEDDLHDLFAAFGQISRIYLAVDKETNRSRGFAFINYVNREDAERAIKALDGYGYSNLILHCEWAAPKDRK